MPPNFLLNSCIILLIYFVISINGVLAQEIEWQKSFGGNQSDALNDIYRTSDNGYILAGNSATGVNGDKTEPSRGGHDYWVIKTDSLGNIEWQKTIGGADIDYFDCVKQTSDGGYLLGGYSYSNTSGDKTEDSNGNLDFWIVKLDSSGNILWQNTIGGNSWDVLGGVAETLDGGYLVGGQSNSGISGDKTDSLKGFADMWILKLNLQGNILWQKTIGGSGGENLNDMVRTNDGGFILCGSSMSDSSYDKTENSNGGADFWVIKIDSLGIIQWQNTIGGDQDDLPYALNITTDGGCIVSGRSMSGVFGDKTEVNRGDYDFWIVKLDDSGSVMWDKTMGGSYIDEPLDVIQLPDGGYAVSGTSYSGVSGNKREALQGTADFWVIRLDSSGLVKWQNAIGGLHQEQGFALANAENGFVAGGVSFSGIGGDKTDVSKGSWDYWIVKVTENYNVITGNLFGDLDSDGIRSPTEPTINYIQVHDLESGRISFSNHIGDYKIVVPDSGNYVATTDTLIYYAKQPVVHSGYFSSIHQTDSLKNFAFQPVVTSNDLCITITPTSPFRPGFSAGYEINFENVGTTIINSPVIIFLSDSNLSYTSSNLLPASVTPDSVVWNLGPLSPMTSGSIHLTVNVNSLTSIGTIIVSGVRIEPIVGDANPSCNLHYWESLVTGSLDPNDILVNRQTLLTTELSNPPYLEYIIRFQNTGNDTAFFVTIVNPVDTTKFLLSSLDFTATSHPVDINFLYHERNLEFKFDNILLPDSNTNEPMSHGFVRYRIKPKSSLVVGDTIKNYAAIYFDFNQPVLTNTANTVVVIPTGFTDNIFNGSNQLQVFPNPVNDELHISFTFPNPDLSGLISILDLSGRVIFSESYNGSDVIMKTDKLNSGIYFIQIQTAFGNFQKKIVKI